MFKGFHKGKGVLRGRYFKGEHLYMVAILALVSFITLISIFLTYKNSKRAAEDSLNLQALGIAVSLETSLNNSDLKKQKDILKEIITESRWEGIAFIALYDRSGTVILHSNENLIGRKVLDENLKRVINTMLPAHTYRILGTNEKVFILDFPAHINNSENVLRLALHTYPVEAIMRQARLHILWMFLTIVVLWVVGYFFIRASRKSEELRLKMAERERFATIGEMASTLAHEIRNPLGSIKGFAQYLIESQESKDKRQEAGIFKEYLDIIISESKRLEALTEDLLIYAKPVDKRIEDCNLPELIKEVVKAMEENKNIDIRISVPSGTTIKSDRAKLKQIFINILQNAIDAGSKVIDIKAESMKDAVAVLIRDDGWGMSPEVKKNAFKPFFTTKTRGTGLGLAIVEKLTKNLGGKIEMESEPQKGTVFRIVIPKNLI